MDHDPGTRSAVFCAVDVETSGLHMGSRLVEIGAVRFSLQGAIDEFHTLVDPMEPIQPGATAIHGITDGMVAGCPHPAAVAAHFAAYLGDAVFIAHNARFDVRVMGMEFDRAGIALPRNPVVDTVQLAREAFPGMPDYRLGTVARNLGITQDREHRGLPDAVAAMEIFRRYAGGAPPRSRIKDIPGHIGSFSDLIPVVEVELSGSASDLQVLVEKKLVVEMVYEGGTSPRMPRMVTPLQVFTQGSGECFRAYCHRTGMVKTFRVDRVVEFRLP